MIKILKIFNNNTVAAILENGLEVILIGPGIGFNHKNGDRVSKSRIKKVYYVQSENQVKFLNMLKKLNVEYLEIAEKIVECAKKTLNRDFSSLILVAITDHISFAIERKKMGIKMPNLLEDEIQMLYPKEYEIGIKSIDYIEERVGYRLDKDEASFIAQHLINATMTGCDDIGIRAIILSKEMIDLIQRTYGITLKKGEIDYMRLMTHLKYLSRRILNKEKQKIVNVDELYTVMLNKNKNNYQFVKQVSNMVEEKYQYQLEKAEAFYLLMHIYKIIGDRI